MNPERQLRNSGFGLRVGLVALAFGVTACVKTCVGIGELGSKERPFVVSIDGWPYKVDSARDFSVIQECVERRAGFRVVFEIYADSRSVVSALSDKRSHLGVMEATAFASVDVERGLAPLYFPGERENFSERSVLVAATSGALTQSLKTGIHLGQSYLSPALMKAHDGVVAYHSQESTVGFLVPRHLLLESGILPSEALFTGDWRISEDLVRQKKVDLAVLSESHIQKQWGAAEVTIGMEKNGLTVVSLSRPFPKRVIVAEQGTSAQVVEGVLNGVKNCAATGARDAIGRSFSGVVFETASHENFAFLRGIVDFQRTFVRVLPQRSVSDGGGSELEATE